jgi:DtxR family transcriptional regulator, Mn-dependent transcriptional regulator
MKIMIANLTKFQDEQEEILYVDTAEAEHVEMYLKAILTVWERKQEVKVSSIAKLLNNILQPSVVHMLHKLNEYIQGNVLIVLIYHIWTML